MGSNTSVVNPRPVIGGTGCRIHETLMSGSKDALKYLNWVDEEKDLQVGMMADAGDETMGLLRFSEERGQGYDKMASGEVANHFVDAIILLFEGKKCLEIVGYTKLVMDLITAVDYQLFAQ